MRLGAVTCKNHWKSRLQPRAGLGLHGGRPIPPATPQDDQAHGAQRPDSRLSAGEALVFSPLGLGCVASNRCKLFVEGQ